MLPRIDLHLEGSVRSSTFLDIARRDGHPFAGVARPRDELVARGPLGGLLPYLAKVDDRIGVIARPADSAAGGRRTGPLNIDNSGVSDVRLSQEHALARYATGFTPERLRTVAEQSVRAAFTDLRIPVG